MDSAQERCATRWSAERVAFLDNLRLLALGMLIIYHVGMYYVTWDWHLKSPSSGTGLEPWMRLVNPWRMSLLFLISGAVTAMLTQREARGWLGSRLQRLGLPLVAGVVLIVPPQSYWQVVEQAGYRGSYLEFLPLYFGGYEGLCTAAGSCLVLPTWNHLWFLPYLMAYTALLWASMRVAPAWMDRAGDSLSRNLTPWTLLVVPWVVLCAGRLALRPWFEVTHALIDDALGHAQFLPAFAAGALLARTRNAWSALARWRMLALLITLAAWALLLAAPAWPAPMLRIVFAAQQWAGVVAAVGFGWAYLGRPTAWQRWLSVRLFAVYVLHQTLIILLAVALRPRALAPWIEGPLLIAGTVAAALGLVRLCEGLPPIRQWVGLPSVGGAPRPGPSAPPP